MTQIKIPLARPYITNDEIELVTSVLKSDILSIGPKIEEFEAKFARFIGTKYAVGVNSGTSGLHLCARALDIKDGNEVITTPFSFVASANCMIYERAKPVFVDVDEKTFNINPDNIKNKITERTKAILPVHAFGQCCDMDPILAIAKKHNLKIIEDACESIGATYKNRNAGTFGDAAVFAFYPNKQMTTAEGGIITTNNESIYELCKSMRNQGRGKSMQWLTHENIGYNYRLNELSAALGIAQLNKIDFLLKRRKEIVANYKDQLEGIEGIQLPEVALNNEHSWFVFPVRVTNQYDRDKVVLGLLKQGIASKAYFYPCIHLQPAYVKIFGYKEGMFPVAEELSKSTFVLPLYPQMNDQVVETVKKALVNALKKAKK